MMLSKTAWDQSDSDCAHVKGSKSPHCFLGKADNRWRIDDGCEARVSKLVFVRLRNQNRCDPDATLQDF
jgi:hypothetical protein